MRDVFTSILATGQGEMPGFLHVGFLLTGKGLRWIVTYGCQGLCID